MSDNAIHLAGADHLAYGDLFVTQTGPVVAAISVGADPESPSLRFKGAIPNEDALSARDGGRFARIVVADSHFGNQASHELVAAVHRAPYDVATPPVVLPHAAVDGSETTLTSVWLDRVDQTAHVHWFGDSLAVRLRLHSPPEVLVTADSRFVTPQHFDWSEASVAIVDVVPGDVLIAFTDGVNECHYREPTTSVTLAHVQAVYDEAPQLGDFVRGVGELALAGVDGHPGGQDNIAIAAIRV